MPENKHLRRLLYFFYAALGILSAWLLIRFVLPWLSPFILAFITARLIEPVIRFLTTRLKWKRSFAAAVCALAVFGIVIGLLVLIIGKAVTELIAFVRDLPSLLSGVTSFLSSLDEKVDGFVHAAPVEIQKYLLSAIERISEKSAEFPAALSSRLVGFLSSAASRTPKIFLFLITFAISVFFISCTYREVADFFLRQIPTRWHGTIRNLKKDFVTTLGKWLKAQLMICTVTFFELAVAFLILKIDYAFLLALIIALIDALPILGTGTVLIPWALFSLVTGNPARAVSLIAVYCIIALVRSFLEPKFIGRQIGLHPVATLAALYVGFCIAGVSGMILFPVTLVMVRQLNDRGYIKLWK